ncbi:hypothetical protein E0485_05705 [Paenibacillus albiflavus]|uniref:Uncharacterized protein n=1 Tax=Paenibacillus albiflavus TaxID=2545760 RepID=A0A4R4ELW8_9BACL|nr:hypothetical protein [Paenibacillus albiflavus]TCZ79355.1 hypothetical protein E0485_05705 [Paenibacillus albiflavus]
MELGAAAGMTFGIFPILIFLFYLALAGLTVYCLILFIMLARRGVKALDLYIDEKTNKIQ